MRCYIIITPELKLTLDLLCNVCDVGEFMSTLTAKIYDNAAIEPEDFNEPVAAALKYWFEHKDQIIREF